MFKYKVLLVEDDPMLRQALAYQLTELGLDVCEAENGATAQQQIKSQDDIKIVITDLNMPDMSGLDLVAWSKESDLPAKLSFILMTGFVDEFNANRARELNVTNFLAKPFDHDFLKMAIESILYGKKEAAA